MLVDSPDRAGLSAALLAAGATASPGAESLVVGQLSLAEVGAIAHRAGIALSLLAPERSGIEDAFLDIVGEGGRP